MKERIKEAFMLAAYTIGATLLVGAGVSSGTYAIFALAEKISDHKDKISHESRASKNDCESVNPIIVPDPSARVLIAPSPVIIGR